MQTITTASALTAGETFTFVDTTSTVWTVVAVRPNPVNSRLTLDVVSNGFRQTMSVSPLERVAKA